MSSFVDNRHRDSLKSYYRYDCTEQLFGKAIEVAAMNIPRSANKGPKLVELY